MMDLGLQLFCVKVNMNVLSPYYLFCRCPRHQNVVNLLGMSSDGPMLCLVYEYVGGGTLSEYLSAVSFHCLGILSDIYICYYLTGPNNTFAVA